MSFLETLAGQLLNRAGVQTHLEVSILLFGLVFCRVVTSVMLAPSLGGPSVPGQIKVGLGAIMAVVLFPTLTQSAGAVHVSAQAYLALLAKEAVVGAAIGFFAQAVFYGIQMAGILIDTQRGMNQVTYLAPQLPGHTSALGNLKLQASIVLFLALGGHLGFLRALANSFTTVPILGMPHLRAGIPALADATTRITATAISIGFQLSAPVLLAILLVDVSFGCIGKVAANIRINQDANTAKAWIGLAVFLLAAAFLLDLLPGFFAAAIQAIFRFTRDLA
jgi:flagellar biosynthesis protein FliR